MKPHVDKSGSLEGRDIIYAHLLVNKELGQACCLIEDTDFGAKYAYCLNLNILWTCKWICEEAVRVLYEENVFVFVIDPRSLERLHEDPLPIAPLARYHNLKDYETPSSDDFRLDDIVGIDRVKRWWIIYGVGQWLGNSLAVWHEFVK